MKKLCAKQNRRAKQWEFRNQFARLRNSQCEISQTTLPIRNAKFRKPWCHFAMRNFANHGAISQCEISQTMVPFRNANFRKPYCQFAMRNFAKDFDAFVRQMNSVLWLQNFRNAKFAMRSWQTTFRNAKWLRTVCENSCFSFSLLIFNICSKICTKLLKLKQEKLHKGTN